MEEAQIVADVEVSPLLESTPLTKSTPLIEASPLSESMQRNKLWGNTNEENNFTIFRTPHNISQSKKNLFEPSVVSIGPFHRNQKHLRVMEEQKWRFLQDFLSRGCISLDLCISELVLLEKITRRCYSETVDLESNAFVEMMLLDGCFILEYFIRRSQGIWNPNVEVGWNSNFIDRDLLLLENQIPFFIVEKLFEIGPFNPERRIIFFKYIAHNFFYRVQTKVIEIGIMPDLPAEIHHLVHLCYHYLVPNPEKPVVLRSKSFDLTTEFHTSCIEFSLSVALPNSTQNISSILIPSATKLKQKGLKFKTKSEPKHMLDISFEYGVLKIPRLMIVDGTKSIFANLIAFEHSKYRKEHSPFTTFVVFLDKLVNTPNDVTILQECGIIENLLGSEEELAHFINQVTVDTFIDGDCHYLGELFTEVNIFSESSWNKQRAKLIRDYFSSPWSTISVIAAFILLVLTLVQSFFAVFTYFRPPSP